MKQTPKIVTYTLTSLIIFAACVLLVERIGTEYTLNGNVGFLFPVLIILFALGLYKISKSESNKKANPAEKTLKTVIGMLLLLGALPASNILPLPSANVRILLAILMVATGIGLIIWAAKSSKRK